MIITEELIKAAFGLVEPTVEVILLADGTTWGPRWVEGFVSAPGTDGTVPFKFGKVTEWNEKWGPKRDSASEIATMKLQVTEDTGEDTSTIVAVAPWLLKNGQYLYPGGASRLGISVAVSGAKGWVDEAIANMVIDCIIMLARLEVDARIARHEMKI